MDVLLVEDDRKIAANLDRGLRAEGMEVLVVHDGRQGLEAALDGSFDLVILDIMLPGLNGYQVCAALRAAGFATPILMLTAKDGEYDEEEGLDTGADDYVVKPFSYRLLLARIRALTRRASREQEREVLAVGDLRIEPWSRRVWKGEEEVTLSSREFDVLWYFADNGGQVLSKTQILDAVWDHAYDGDQNIVEVYVSRLRRRLGDDILRTVHGIGYRLADGR